MWNCWLLHQKFENESIVLKLLVSLHFELLKISISGQLFTNKIRHCLMDSKIKLLKHQKNSFLKIKERITKFSRNLSSRMNERRIVSYHLIKTKKLKTNDKVFRKYNYYIKMYQTILKVEPQPHHHHNSSISSLDRIGDKSWLLVRTVSRYICNHKNYSRLSW